HEKFTHLTNGAIVGAIGLTLSLLALIYFANRLRLLYIFKGNLGENTGFHFENLSTSPHAFYKEYGIDPELYTLAVQVEIQLPLFKQTDEEGTYEDYDTGSRVSYIG